MKPFNSVDGSRNLEDLSRVAAFEKSYGNAAVAVNTYGLGIQLCLEALGSRSNLVPVILPITASPETLAAVLRSGAQPLLLDIDPSTLQLAPELTIAALEDIPGAVVVLTRPGGQKVDPRLLEATKGFPTILDSRLCPYFTLEPEEVQGTFSVFDLDPITTGAIVFAKFDKQVEDIKTLRSHPLGHQGHLSPILIEHASAYQSNSLQWGIHSRQSEVAKQYLHFLTKNYIAKAGVKPKWLTSKYWPYFVIEVPDAQKVLVELHSLNISVKRPVFPLHYLDEVKTRYQVPPVYKVAEELSNKLLALPTHPGMVGYTTSTIETVLEVVNG